MTVLEQINDLLGHLLIAEAEKLELQAENRLLSNLCTVAMEECDDQRRCIEALQATVKDLQQVIAVMP